MKKIQCELCGSLDIVKINIDTFQCQHCGCKYSAEQARLMISGTVEYTKGNAELARLLNNAETQIKLKNPNAALKIYNDLSNEYPAEYQVWNGFLNLLYSEYLANKSFIAFINSGIGVSIDKVQNGALTTCPSSEQTQLKKMIDDFWNTVYNDTLNGSFRLFNLGGEVYWQFEEQLKQVSSYHPLMKQLIAEGIVIAKKMNEMGIHYGYMNSYNKGELSFWHNKLDNGIGFKEMWLVIGKMCVCHGKHHLDDYAGSGVMIMPISASNRADFFDTINRIAIENAEKLTICPFCLEGKIKKGLFGGKRCSSCGKPMDY